MAKCCNKPASDSIKLEVEARGPNKKRRKKLLMRRLRRACKLILKGKYPDQPRTKFKENMGGGGGP